MHWQLLTVVLIAAGTAPADDAKKDEEKMQGTWTVVSMEWSGNKESAEDVKEMKVTVKDNSITISNGRRDETTTFKLDPSKTPKAFDFKDKDQKGGMGIYELDGDDLKLCFVTEEGKKRPTEFTSKRDSGHTLIVLKRQKK
jgi:uncharacterized protein (TIGR03067 family)